MKKTENIKQINAPLAVHRQVEKIALTIEREWGPVRPERAIIMGSGWGQALSNWRDELKAIPYSRAGFTSTRVIGHGETLYYSPKYRTLIFSGRFHLYTGIDSWQAVMPVLVGHILGIGTLVLTNAAGALEAAFPIGSIVFIEDQINFTHYKIAIPDWKTGTPYHVECYGRLAGFVQAEGIETRRGVYCGLVGPAYETPAEARYFYSIGAHLVGMSSVLEAEAAATLGIQVIGLSLVTNYVPMSRKIPEKLDHHDVLAVAGQKLTGMILSLQNYFQTTD